MSIFSFISEELKSIGIVSVSELNKRKNKELKEGLAHRALDRYLQSQPKNSKGKPLGKSATFKFIKQETGLKFSNEKGREWFNDLKDIQPTSDYGSKLRSDVKPKLAHIPLTEKAKQTNYIPRDEFLYIFDVFVRTEPNLKIKHKIKYKLKALPKSKNKNVRRVDVGGYMTKEPYCIYSSFPFTKEQIMDEMEAIINGTKSTLGGLERYIETSDTGNIFDSTKTIVGFKFAWLVRN